MRIVSTLTQRRGQRADVAILARNVQRFAHNCVRRIPLPALTKSLLALSVLVGCAEPTTTNITARSGTIAWLAKGVISPTLSGTLAADSQHVYVYNSNVSIAAIRLGDHQVDWVAQANDGEGSNSFSMRGVVTCAGLVVFGSYRRAYAVDPSTGRQRWSWLPSRGGSLFDGVPACDGSTLYFGTVTPMLVYAVDAATGLEERSMAVNRRAENDGFATSPQVARGVVATCTREFGNPFTGMVVAFEAATGSEKWRFTWTPPPPFVSASCTQAVAISNGILAASVDDGRVFGLDLQTGALAWTAPRVSQARDERPIAIVGNVVMAGSLTGIVTGIDIASGTTLWTTVDRDTAITNINLPILGDGGAFYGTTLSGSALSFDALTGRRLWLTPTNTVINTGELFGPGVLTSSLYILVGANGIYAYRR